MLLTPFNNMINEVQRKIGERKRKKEKRFSFHGKSLQEMWLKEYKLE